MLLEQYEKTLLTKVRPEVMDFFNREGSWKLDQQVRIWIILRVPELFDPAADYPKSKVEDIMRKLWGPTDLEEATVHNSIFMRFCDFSPMWIHREITTGEVYYGYLLVRLIFSHEMETNQTAVCKTRHKQS